jgi:hypothetical protein
METLRIAARNIVHDEIKQTELIVKRNKDTIDRLRNSQTNMEFNKKQVEKLSLTQTELYKKLENLKQKYIDINSGVYDKDFITNKTENESKLKKEVEKQNKKNKEKEEKKIQNKEILDNEYQMRRFSGPSEYSLKKETDKFFKSIETVPSFILENLKNMPSNKGYIWRGVYYYGKLPSESKNVIMFEKCRNNIMKIHECINNRIYIYEKVGKGPKKLIETIERNSYIMNETNRIISSFGFFN